MTPRRVLIVALVFAILSPMLIRSQLLSAKPTNSPEYSAPPLLTYRDLVELGSKDPIEPGLKARLNELVHTPFISNEFGTNPRLPINYKVGKVVRIAEWNIERGLRLDDIKMALSSPNEYLQKVRATNSKEFPPNSDQYIQLKSDLSIIHDADILVLNEVDLGIKRTGYRNVARELAQALHMNYVYGVEFIEVDPVNLGTENFVAAGAKTNEALQKRTAVDRTRYLGLHGSAILSRFPILSAKVHPFDYQGYDWYNKEKKKISIAERGRREAAKEVFLEKIHREIRRGGRMAIIADVAMPALPEGKVTIAATHLEDHAKPYKRQHQMEELLGLVSNIHNPVIVVGDMNTAGFDEAPTSIRRMALNRLGNEEFWATEALGYFTPAGPSIGLALKMAKMVRNDRDPTTKDIFLIGSNSEANFFTTLRNYRFKDGGIFDFRGDNSRTVNGTSGTLANSNARATKGFDATFEMERQIGPLGGYKLDWFFVKSYLKAGGKGKGSYLFAPHFPRTLQALNHSLPGRLSDHNPITVDLPLYDPDERRPLSVTTNNR